MLAAKLRKATDKDIQELNEFSFASIKNVHTDDYERKVLLEEFSRENIEKWFEEESTKIFVATYMGFIIGCCVYRYNCLSNLLVSENYQHQGIETSLWGFARDNALVSGNTKEFNGEVLHLYAQEIIKKLAVTEKDAYELYTVLEQAAATKSDISEAKESLRRLGKRGKYHLLAHTLNLLVLSFLLTGAYRYVFSPTEALLVLTHKITHDTDVSWGKVAKTERYAEWKIDFLLWRGAKPNYSTDTSECYGAASVAMLWLQPKLLNDLTSRMSEEEKIELMEKCSPLFPEPRYSDRVREIKDILGI